MRVDLRDRYIGSSLYLNGQYEAEFQRLVRSMDLRDSVCLDIGANVGTYALLLSELAGNGRVYAFEPEDKTFDLLEHNLNINRATNVEALHAAVGSEIGKCYIAIAEENLGDHRVLTETSIQTNRQQQESSLTTVDAVLKDVPDGRVKFIKIDVQGYELHVVKGMIATLKRNPDAILLIEISPAALRRAGSSVTELMHLLSNTGLSGWELHDYRISPIAEPWVYELIRYEREENFILSQNGELLRQVLSNFYGYPPLPGLSPLRETITTSSFA